MPNIEKLPKALQIVKRVKRVKALVALLAGAYLFLPDELLGSGIKTALDSTTVKTILACIASELAK